MDLVRLGEPYSTVYTPDKLIEGYSSLIWTERHQAFGEFELKSVEVQKMKELLPYDALVSHLETQQVMMVETRTIAPNEDGHDEITIRGRTLDCILESRVVAANYGKKRKMRRKYTGTAASAVLLYNAIDNASGKDVTRGDTDPDTEATLNDYPWTTLDRIPNVAITETIASEGEARWWTLQAGILYPQLMKIMTSQDLGLRTIRPVHGSNGNVVTVKASPLADRGDLVRTLTENITALRFDIYTGVDRTDDVSFSLLQGDLKDPQYLYSNREKKTEVEIKAGISIGDVNISGESGLSGIRRRVVDMDAGSPELPPEPEKPDELGKNATKAQREARAEAVDEWRTKIAKWRNKRDRIYADFREEARAEAKSLLRRKHRAVSMFSGDITPSAPYRYKVDYDLGDLVILHGGYGESEEMVVGEYVRTEDKTGDRGFPGLIAP